MNLQGSKKYELALFIFRRDLRLIDNTALNHAIELSNSIIPCFIFDPHQINPKYNKFFSRNAFQFMVESLQDLEVQLKKYNGSLHFFEGMAGKTIKQLISQFNIEALFINKDYTPFSLQRDNTIQKICEQNSVDFHQYDDVLLQNPELIIKNDKSPYAIFTPFFKAALKFPVSAPHSRLRHYSFGSLTQQPKKCMILDTYIPTNTSIYVHGGRKNGLLLLKNIKNLKQYANTRDYPQYKTSSLSSHLKFGTLSPREVYKTIIKQLGIHHPLIRQLYWREFFTYILYHNPYVLGYPFHKQFAKIPWTHNETLFAKWCTGKTGFPIIDAGMNQLNQTGFMHNRVRLITASFLVKDLHIDWQKGERYFAQKLVDYDPALNNGNWQWVASTGCDAQPYFRIFNPWLQQKKFDKECTYIKEWIPELGSLSPKAIHNWFKMQVEGIQYPKPIIDHAKESQYAKRVYKRFNSNLQS